MIRVICLLMLFFNTYNFFGQTKEFTANGNQFEIIASSFNDTLQKEYITIYKDKTALLSHTTYASDGDCSSENLQLGAYEIENTKIVLYSYWAGADRMGKNMYPFGYKKEIYHIRLNGTVVLEKAVLYIEDYIDSYEKPKGIDFLYKKPKRVSDKKILNVYKAAIERLYKGDFVTGEKLKILEKEVRAKLASEIKKYTSSWKEIYGKNQKS